jgi:hypothetical protein
VGWRDGGAFEEKEEKKRARNDQSEIKLERERSTKSDGDATRSGLGQYPAPFRCFLSHSPASRVCGIVFYASSPRHFIFHILLFRAPLPSPHRFLNAIYGVNIDGSGISIHSARQCAVRGRCSPFIIVSFDIFLDSDFNGGNSLPMLRSFVCDARAWPSSQNN